MGSRRGRMRAVDENREALRRAKPAEPANPVPCKRSGVVVVARRVARVARVADLGSQQKRAGAQTAGCPQPTGITRRRATIDVLRLTRLTPQWSATRRACALVALGVLCVLCAVGARSFSVRYGASDGAAVTHAQVAQVRNTTSTTSTTTVELVEVVGMAPTTPTAGGGTALPTCSVDVGPVHTPIDPCKWATQAVLAVVGWLTDTTITSLDGIIGAVVSSQVLLGTPHVLTDQNPAVANLLALLTALALALLAIIIGVQGYALILGPHLGGGFRYAEAREVFPRLLVGAAATVVIPWMIGQFIDFSNLLGSAAVTNSFVPVTAPSLGDLGNGANPAIEELVLAFVVLGYTIFALLVVLQVFVRLATLDLLIVLAPLAMVCWILPQTRVWTERWTTLLCGVLLAQPLQLLTISLGLGLATNLPSIPGFGQLFGGLQATLAEGLLCLATYYVAFKIPRLVSQIGLGSSTLGAALDGLRTGGQLVRTGLMVAGFF